MTARKVLVQTGQLEKNLIAVNFKGPKIKAGDCVIVQGNERLKPNAEINIIKKIR